MFLRFTRSVGKDNSDQVLESIKTYVFIFGFFSINSVNVLIWCPYAYGDIELGIQTTQSEVQIFFIVVADVGNFGIELKIC